MNTHKQLNDTLRKTLGHGGDGTSGTLPAIAGLKASLPVRDHTAKPPLAGKAQHEGRTSQGLSHLTRRDRTLCEERRLWPVQGEGETGR